MFSSAAAALSQMFDARFRGVFWLGLGGTVALFVGLMFGLQWVVTHVPDFGLSWVKEAYRIISASLLTISFIFLGVPVAQMFASVFLDRVADAVEAKHYAGARHGGGAGFWGMLRAGLLFSGVSFGLNLLSIPLTLASFGIGAAVMFFVNGYLAGRTFFELAALRHLTPADARQLRRKHRLRLFLGGALIAMLSMIPLLNFFVPLFGAAMMTHEFNKLVKG
ncbi:MAG: EI24 domain-containing protein [Alphaproteobacteria bacterium]